MATPERPKAPAAVALREARPHRIGPLLEYAAYRSNQKPDLPELRLLPRSAITAQLKKILDKDSNTGVNHSLHPQQVEFAWGPGDLTGMATPRWVTFCKRIERAARGAGLDETRSGAFTGAFREIIENAILHSERPQAVLAGYRWTAREVEFAVTDPGIGALRSLQTCPEFRDLGDHGDALRAALTDGVSRFGRQTGHGTGFRPIFVNLLGIKGFLRFRSGDHALEMTVVHADLGRATLRQRVHYQGLMANLVCQRPSESHGLVPRA